MVGFTIQPQRVLVWSVCFLTSSDVSGLIRLLTLCSFEVSVLLREQMIGSMVSS